MIADPYAVATRWPDERARALAELARLVSEAPWSLSRARLAILPDDDVLHAVALAAFFGHLNRIADAVAVPLDYAVRLVPPHAESATPPYSRAPRAMLGNPSLTLAQRPTTAAAFAAWRDHVAIPRGLLDARQRAMIAARVGQLVGASTEPSADLDPAIRTLVDLVTLAPWRLDDASFAALRSTGFDDAALFDVCVASSTAGMLARIDVALTALG